MKKFISILFFTGMAFSVEFSNSFASGTIPFYLKPVKTARYRSGEVLVKFKSHVSKQVTVNSMKIVGAKFLTNVDGNGLQRVKIPGNLEVKDAIEQFKHDPNVEYAQPNYIYHTQAVPNDPQYDQLWGLHNSGQIIAAANGPDPAVSTHNPGTSGKDMNLPGTWDKITDCSSVLVAVIDTGVNYNQSDLANNMWDGGSSYPNHGYDFVDSDNDPMDKHGHGTHVAGTIGAVGNNATGTTGVCWKANLMALRVADASGAASTADTVAAVNFAIAHNVKVINMSLGGFVYDSAFDNALTNANNAGIISVVAAGNNGEDVDSGSTPHYPCNYTHNNIICVAALDQEYSLASFSNYGFTSVDLAAPGVNIVSTWVGSQSSSFDSLSSGWFSSTNVSGSGWGYKQLQFSTLTNTLANPASYDYSTVHYQNNADDRIWKSFNLSGAYAATADFYIMYDAETNHDGVIVYANNLAGDPVVSGTALDGYTGSTGGYSFPETIDISDFISANTTVGFNFISDASTVNFGANISLFSTTALTLNNTTYNVLRGTSMAAPHVTGLVALVWAYNPNYTAADVVTAVKGGGDSLSILTSKTTTGKAANALGSLAFIQAPTNLSVVKQ